MEIIYDSKIDINVLPGIQYNLPVQAEALGMTPAAAGTLNHASSLIHDTPMTETELEEVDIMAAIENDHQLDPTFIVHPNSVGDGATSSDSNSTPRNSFFLKRSSAAVGFARNPMHAETVALRSSTRNSLIPGKSLGSSQLSPSPPSPPSVNPADPTSQVQKNDWEFEEDELTTTETALDRLIRAIRPASSNIDTTDLISLENSNHSLLETLNAGHPVARSTHHGNEVDSANSHGEEIVVSSNTLSNTYNDKFITSQEAISKPRQYPQDSPRVIRELGPNQSKGSSYFSHSPYNPVPLLPQPSQPSPLAPAAIIEEQRQGNSVNKVTFADRLGITHIRSHFSPEASQNSTPRAASHTRPLQVLKILSSVTRDRPEDSLSSQGGEAQFDDLGKARFGEEFSRYPAFPAKELPLGHSNATNAAVYLSHIFPSVPSNDAPADPAGVGRHQTESVAHTQEPPFAIPRARAQTDAGDQSSRKERFFVSIPRPNVGKVIAKAAKLVTSHSASNIFSSFTRPRAHSSPSLGSGDYNAAYLTISTRKRLSSDGHGDSDWRPPTSWDMPEWQPQDPGSSSLPSDWIYAVRGSELTSSPELSPFLQSSPIQLPDEDADDEVTSSIDEDTQTTPKPREVFRKRHGNDSVHALTQEEERRCLHYKPRRIHLRGDIFMPTGTPSLPALAPPTSTPPPPIPPRHPSRSLRGLPPPFTPVQQPPPDANTDEVVNGECLPHLVDILSLADALEDVDVEIPVFRNKIFAMFTASSNPGNGTSEVSKAGVEDMIPQESDDTHWHDVSSSLTPTTASDEGIGGRPHVDNLPLCPSYTGLGISNVEKVITAAQVEKINWYTASAKAPSEMAHDDPSPASSEDSRRALVNVPMSRGIKSKQSMPNLTEIATAKPGSTLRDPSQVIVLKKGSLYKQASLSKSMTQLTTLLQPPMRPSPIPKYIPPIPKRAPMAEENDPQVVALLKATRAKAKKCYLNRTPQLNRF